MRSYLEFEKPIAELEAKIAELKQLANQGNSDISDDLERWGRHLEPCGMGNPAPVFGMRQLRLAGARTVGSNHLKATLSGTGTSLDAIAFNWADRATAMATGTVDVDVTA